MSNNQERVEAYLKENPSAGRYVVAEALGITQEQARTCLYKVRNGISWSAERHKRSRNGNSDSPQSPAVQGVKDEHDGDGRTVSSKGADIKNVDQLLAYLGVNTDEWEVDRHVLNKWEVGARDDEGKVVVTPLFQVKAWLKRKAREMLCREIQNAFLAELRKASVTVKYSPPPRSDYLLEMAIFDHHMGKLCWEPEVGENYDCQIAEELFYKASESLIHQAKGFGVERILLPLGNDLLNVDNAVGTTTKGTRQDEDGRWQKTFARAKVMLLKTVERMATIAPVDVVMVAGNHDTERLFYLGEVLSAYFDKSKRVTVNNEPTKRKYFRYGANLIGFTHGNEEKKSNLPLIMATERSHDWAETTFREWHTGHFHHKSENHFQPVKEHNGIRERIIPSLTPADAWHKGMGYEGLRAAEGYVWRKQGGVQAVLSYYAD